MADEFQAFARDVRSVANALKGNALSSAMQKAGVQLTKVADGALAGQLGGDGRFSGWPGPGQMRSKATVHPDGQGVTIHRDKRSAGVIRVGEDGRNQGNSGGFAGPGVNRRTGLTSRTKSGKLRKVRQAGRRWNGRTAGKGVWSSAEAALSSAAPKAIEDGVLDVVEKLWGG